MVARKHFGSSWTLGLVFVTGILAADSSRAGEIIQVPGDHPTIQDAVDAASDQDVIKIGAGDFQGAVISKPLWISGAGISTRIVDPVKSPNDWDSGIVLLGGSEGTRISHLKIMSGGETGVFAEAFVGDITLSHLEFSTPYSRGAVYFDWDNPDVTVQHSTFKDSHSAIPTWMSDGWEVSYNEFQLGNEIGLDVMAVMITGSNSHVAHNKVTFSGHTPGRQIAGILVMSFPYPWWSAVENNVVEYNQVEIVDTESEQHGAIVFADLAFLFGAKSELTLRNNAFLNNDLRGSSSYFGPHGFQILPEFLTDPEFGNVFDGNKE